MADKGDDDFNEKLEAERKKFDMERRIRKTYEAISPTSVKGSCPLNSSQHGLEDSSDNSRYLSAVSSIGGLEDSSDNSRYLSAVSSIGGLEDRLDNSRYLSEVSIGGLEDSLDNSRYLSEESSIGEAQIPSFDFNEDQVEDLWATLNQGTPPHDPSRKLAEMKKVYMEFEELLSQQEEKLQSIVEKLESPNICPERRQQMTNELNTVLMAHEETRLNLMQIVESLMRLGQAREREQQATRAQTPSFDFSEQHVQDLWATLSQGAAPADQGREMVDMMQVYQEFEELLSQQEEKLQRIVEELESPNNSPEVQQQLISEFNTMIRAHEETRMNLMQIVESLKLGEGQARDQQATSDKNQDTRCPLARTTPQAPSRRKKEQWKAPVTRRTPAQRAPISQRTRAQRAPVTRRTQPQRVSRKTQPRRGELTDKEMEKYFKPSLRPPPRPRMPQDMEEDNDSFGTWPPPAPMPLPVVRPKYESYPVPAKDADVKPSIGHPSYYQSLGIGSLYKLPIVNVPLQLSPVKRGFKKGTCPLAFAMKEEIDPAKQAKYFQKPYLSQEERDRYNKLLDSQPLNFDFTDYQTPEQVKGLWDEINRREEEQRRLLDEITKTKRAKFRLEDDLAEQAEELREFEEKLQCPDISPDRRRQMTRSLGYMQENHEQTRARLIETVETLRQLGRSQKKETPPPPGLRPDTTRLGDDLLPKGFVLQAAPKGRKRSNTNLSQ